MKVDVRHVDDVIIVDLEGRLVMGVGDELLRDVMNQLIAEDWKKILLNLRKVTIIDTGGLLFDLLDLFVHRLERLLGAVTQQLRHLQLVPNLGQLAGQGLVVLDRTLLVLR